MQSQKIICFDVGGTKIAKAVVEITEDKFDFVEEAVLVENPRNETEIKKVILEYASEMREKHQSSQVAVSIARIVDSKNRAVSFGSDLYGTEDLKFDFLSDENFEIEIENDGRCFALGEYHFGKAKGCSSVLTLTMGTGIGGGFIFEGERLRGFNNSALEVSHTKPFKEDSDDWENLGSGVGIEKQYFKRTGNKKTTEEIFQLSQADDVSAKEAINEAEEILGVGIANLLNVLDPEAVILGGSISNQENFISNVFEIAKKNVFNKKASYKFEISLLKEKANLLGAACLFIK